MQCFLLSTIVGGAFGKLETERMSTTTTHVFDPLVSNLVQFDEVAQHYARQRMPDKGDPSLCFDERVPTRARILCCFWPRSYLMNAMSQQPADIVNLFLESAAARVRILVQLKQQWVTAPFTDILAMRGAARCQYVVMRTEETGQGMSYA
jgi:hypothetical protein